LEVPVSFKIKNGERKHILKKMANRKGLPNEITHKNKKAIQYSSGVDKTLRRLAKGENKRLKKYLLGLKETKSTINAF
jgi:asparagine synthase (glutamine-hydrolysing)